MTSNDGLFQRLGVIIEIAKQAPQDFGRTALMKCLYFLKILKGVPLPYSFRLYTYGPFDADVLDDLRYAESLGAVNSKIEYYPGGYAYRIHAGPQAEKIADRASDFISKYRESIAWVVRKFGNRFAMDLEMASTLVYIDRALAEEGATASFEELAKKVQDVKPHLTMVAIEREARSLEGFLKSVK